MSAGGLSYDGLTTSRKATLPSVEMWGTNMNILKDPPKGIFTRRNDKVGQTQGTLIAQEESGDRIAECINVYARGVNPMVSVSYDNYSNNSGAHGTLRNQGVKLPYRPEVFRPPVLRAEDLMPLSRQPRNWFYALTNPSVPNVVNQMSCTESKSSTYEDAFKVEAPPSYQKNIEIIQPVSAQQTGAIQNNFQPLLEVNPNKKSYQRNDDFSRYLLKKLQTASLVEEPLRYSTTAPKSKPSDSIQIAPEKLQEIKASLLHLKNVHSSFSKGFRDEPLHKNTSYGIQENKLQYQMLTQKIKQLENIILGTEPSNAINPSILHPSTEGTYSSFSRDSNDRGFVPASSSVRDTIQNVQASTSFSSPFQSEGVTQLDAVNYILPGNKLGTWVQSKQQFPSKGQNRTFISQDLPEASKSHLYTSVQTPISSLQWQNPEMEMKQNVRDIQSINMSSAKTLPGMEKWNHPETVMEPRPNRPLAQIESINQQSPTTKTLLHENLRAGNIDQNYKTMEADTMKTSYDRKGEYADPKLQRRVLLIEEATTARDTQARGDRLYGNVQSVQAQSQIGHRPEAGGFSGLGNFIPRAYNEPQMDRLPVNNDWNNLKKEAYKQFSERR